MIVGSGIDVIEIARIERALERGGRRFEQRVFTAGEIVACRRARRAAAQFALRFAAKEAAMKAVGTGWAKGVRWRDIEAVPPPGSDGAGGAGWELNLSGRVREIASERGGRRVHLSVSRTRTHALAVVLLEEGSG